MPKIRRNSKISEINILKVFSKNGKNKFVMKYCIENI
jgi:hypothetical protein